jgi:hypothetical protein
MGKEECDQIVRDFARDMEKLRAGWDREDRERGWEPPSKLGAKSKKKTVQIVEEDDE